MNEGPRRASICALLSAAMSDYPLTLSRCMCGAFGYINYRHFTEGHPRGAYTLTFHRTVIDGYSEKHASVSELRRWDIEGKKEV